MTERTLAASANADTNSSTSPSSTRVENFLSIKNVLIKNFFR